MFLAVHVMSRHKQLEASTVPARTNYSKLINICMNQGKLSHIFHFILLPSDSDLIEAFIVGSFHVIMLLSHLLNLVACAAGMHQ